MKTTTNRRVEAFLLVTFPMAVFVGCAGNANTKQTTAYDINNETTPGYVLMEEDTDAPAFTKEAHLLIDLIEKDKVADINKLEPTAMDNPFVVSNGEEEITPESTATNTVTDDQPESSNEQNTLQITLIDDHESDTQKMVTDQDEGKLQGNIVDVKFSEPKQPKLNIINFASADTDIDLSYLMSLKQHAEFLAQNPNLILTVSGHSDSVGSAKSNFELSEERAINVYHILLSYGAPESQLIVDAFGETSPLNDEANHQENRRVELEYSEEVYLSSIN